jgi:hypothetical protein
MANGRGSWLHQLLLLFEAVNPERVIELCLCWSGARSWAVEWGIIKLLTGNNVWDILTLSGGWGEKQGALDMALRVINDIVSFQEELEAQAYNEVESLAHDYGHESTL